MAFLNQIQSLAQLLLPARATDTTVVNNRADGYGNLAVNTFFNKKQALAAEGSYFVTTNPTPGTGIAGTLVTSYANTAGWWWFQNWNAPGGPTAYLDYLKLIVTVAAASSVSFRTAIIRDLATPISTQVTTNHVTSVSPVGLNGGTLLKSNCTFTYQSNATASVNVAPSQASAIIGQASLGGIQIVGDEIVLDFGATDPAPQQGLTAAQATCPGRKVSVLPPIAVPPGQQIMIVPWFPSNATTALSYEFELTHIER